MISNDNNIPNFESIYKSINLDRLKDRTKRISYKDSQIWEKDLCILANIFYILNLGNTDLGFTSNKLEIRYLIFLEYDNLWKKDK